MISVDTTKHDIVYTDSSSASAGALADQKKSLQPDGHKRNGGAAVPVTCDRKERSLCTGNTAADLSKDRSASDPAPLSLHRL